MPYPYNVNFLAGKMLDKSINKMESNHPMQSQPTDSSRLKASQNYPAWILRRMAEQVARAEEACIVVEVDTSPQHLVDFVDRVVPQYQVEW